MGDESRWNDQHDRSNQERDWGDRYRRDGGPEWRGQQGQGEQRLYGAGDYERSHAPQDDYPRYASSDRGRAYASDDSRSGGWPPYNPGHDSAAYNDRSGWRGLGRADDRPQGGGYAQRGPDYGPAEHARPRDQDRQNQGEFAGWDAPFGGKPVHNQAHDERDDQGGPLDRLRDEGRRVIDRTREEISSLFGGRRDDTRRDAPHQNGEHRGRGPRGYRRADARIAEDVNDRLTEDSWLDASDIDVRVHEAEVTLDGWVRTRGDKRRAEDLAEQVAGVRHVQNNLRVGDNPQANAAGVSTY